jgi:hypothetical protein
LLLADVLMDTRGPGGDRSIAAWQHADARFDANLAV